MSLGGNFDTFQILGLNQRWQMGRSRDSSAAEPPKSMPDGAGQNFSSRAGRSGGKIFLAGVGRGQKTSNRCGVGQNFLAGASRGKKFSSRGEAGQQICSQDGGKSFYLRWAGAKKF